MGVMIRDRRRGSHSMATSMKLAAGGPLAYRSGVCETHGREARASLLFDNSLGSPLVERTAQLKFRSTNRPYIERFLFPTTRKRFWYTHKLKFFHDGS